MEAAFGSGPPGRIPGGGLFGGAFGGDFGGAFGGSVGGTIGIGNIGKASVVTVPGSAGAVLSLLASYPSNTVRVYS